MKALKLEPVAEGRCAKRLVGLPGTSRELSGVWVSSVSEAVSFIREGCAVIASGDGGAIVVWKGDDGQWRCEFAVHQRAKAFDTFKHVAAVAAWLKEWWPKLKR